MLAITKIQDAETSIQDMRKIRKKFVNRPRDIARLSSPKMANSRKNATVPIARHIKKINPITIPITVSA